MTYECASIFIAYELYEQYGDARILEKYYPGMKKYMEYMKDKGLPGSRKPGSRAFRRLAGPGRDRSSSALERFLLQRSCPDGKDRRHSEG